ncbi:complement receptor type 2-like [Heptranchias perlo]|uniref:complement receptor type 2-like n=1 Tax=Heptranchias perlo TaxID=212740 RepID=UPI00355949B5
MFQKIELTITLICMVHISTTLVKDCGTPMLFDNGYSTFLNTTYGSRVTHTCYPGYILNGKSFQSCTVRGWDGKAPECIPRSCGNPGEILNGYYEAPSVEFGNKATFYCDHGYQMVGRNYRLCAADGWDGMVPTCETITCNDLPPISNGITPSAPNERQWEYGVVAQYSCIDDYTLIGADKLVCTATGKWDKDPPTCKVVRCYRHELPKNGHIVVGFGPSYKYREMATYRCNYGFEMVGSNVIECMENSEFQPPPPTCKLSGCYQPRKIIHGTMLNKKDMYLLREKITYRCYEGYKMVGKEVIECMENNTFVPQPPSCRLIECRSPGNIANGNRWSKNEHYYTYGAQIKYHCNSGFELVGKSVIQCKEDGNFFPQPPTCRKVCPTPRNIYNGFIISSAKTVYKNGDQVTYRCNSGFELVGESVIQCKEDGNFFPHPPTCRKVECRSPGDIANGYRWPRNEHYYTYGAQIKYRCYSGFELVGKSVIQCKEDGNFFPQPPTCQKVCPTPRNIYNGIIISSAKTVYKNGDQVTYRCNSGFELVGESVIQCKEDGNFFPHPPTCQKVPNPTSDTSSIQVFLKEIVALVHQIITTKKMNIIEESAVLRREREILETEEKILQKIEQYVNKRNIS